MMMMLFMRYWDDELVIPTIQVMRWEVGSRDDEVIMIQVDYTIMRWLVQMMKI